MTLRWSFFGSDDTVTGGSKGSGGAGGAGSAGGVGGSGAPPGSAGSNGSNGVDGSDGTAGTASHPTIDARSLTSVVVITTMSLPNATVGHAYSVTLRATSGRTPYHWSVTSGSLPAGLSLNSSGKISGAPTRAGMSRFTVSVRDSFETGNVVRPASVDHRALRGSPSGAQTDGDQVTVIWDVPFDAAKPPPPPYDALTV